MSKLVLIDGSSLLHRAFYALPLLSNHDGVFTNAVHGFMMMFNKITQNHKPDLLVVCFDKSRHTFRTDMYADYKGTRSETAMELRSQFELIKEVLQAAGVSWLELENYEADDIIGTLSAQGRSAGCSVEIFSGDKDVLQLVDEGTVVYLTRKGISDMICYDEAAIMERYQLTPAQLIDLKGLMGDSSDNIPGVPGVGEKTALKLLAEYSSIDELYARLDEVKGKMKDKLQQNRDMAYLSRQLATICRDVPLEKELQDYTYDPAGDKTALAAVYKRLGLRQLLRGLNIDNSVDVWPVNDASMEDKPWPEQAEADNSSVVAVDQRLQNLADSSYQCALLWNKADTAVQMLYNGQLLHLTADDLLAYRSVIEDPECVKVASDGKELFNWLLAQGIEMQGLRDDVIIAAYLLDPTRGDYLLTDLMSEHGLSSTGNILSQLPVLAVMLREKLQKSAMFDLYEKIEMPLIKVLSKMELAGIRVREEDLSNMSEILLQQADSYQKQIYQLAGHEFNINSPKQLGVVLFEEMGIPPLKKNKTGYSTDAEVLETLANSQPIARLILDYRLATKLRGTYTEGMGKLIGADGRIHTSFMQTVTATGRLSSVEPNLQNIPVRHEIGRKIREVFVADSENDFLLAADYSQIELRVLAHLSGDDKLIQAYRDGEDIHARTAAEVFGVALDEVTSVERRAAKAVNFGIIYGISDYGLSKDLGISRYEAKTYIDMYFSRYPQVADYLQKTIQKARENTYVETIMGRKRSLPDINSRNFNLRSFAERVAMNAPVQGSAADIIKLAMVNIDKCMTERGLRSRMLLQVHDELIFNVPADEMSVMTELIKEQMENVCVLKVPLVVDIKVGTDWYNMKKYSI